MKTHYRRDLTPPGVAGQIQPEQLGRIAELLERAVPKKGPFHPAGGPIGRQAIATWTS
ncbi:MAG: hypothetical protein M3069_17625 [Chloroflexota bacterium]|nr:hypothetical protein [Chloroflexota bacterium]